VKSFLLKLVLVCALGFALRVSAIVLVPTQPVSDFWSYHRRAENLLDVGVYGVRPGRPDATWPPGYPLALAAALRRSGRSLFAAKLLNVSCGVLAVFLAGLLGRRLGGERAGLWTAGIAAVYPRLVLLPCLLASENLFLPLLFLFFLLLALSWSRPRTIGGVGIAIAGGLVLGALALTRSAGYFLFFVWPLAGLLARKSWTKVAAETLVVLLAQHAAMLPWALRNHAVFGTFSFLTSSSGATLYMGNNPRATGEWYSVKADLQQLPGLAGRNWFERDRVFRQEAVRWMRENPGQAARLFAKKLGLMFHEEGIVDMTVNASQAVPAQALPPGAPPGQVVQALPDDHLLKRNPTALAVLRGTVAVGYWLLVVLEIGGALLLLARAIRTGEPVQRAAAGAFLGAALYIAAIGALFHGDPRYRWPANDVLIPVAGLALVKVVSREGGPSGG